MVQPIGDRTIEWEPFEDSYIFVFSLFPNVRPGLA